MNKKNWPVIAVAIVSALASSVVFHLLLFSIKPAVAQESEVIKAQKILLVDSKGVVRAIMGFANDEPLISLMDKSGNSRVEMGTGRGFTIFDEKGNRRILLAVLPGGEPVFNLRDNKGNNRFTLLVTRDEGTVFSLANKGNRRIELGVLPNGASLFNLRDNKGNRRIDLGVLPDGEPIMTIYDANRKIIWGAP